MKRLTFLFLAGVLVCSAGEITLTKSAMLKAERNMVSLKAGTVVELLSRDEKTLTIRYNKLTGTIPASRQSAAQREEPPVVVPVQAVLQLRERDCPQ